MAKISSFLILSCGLLFMSCHPEIKETRDKLYSRHLQKHITLTIVSTPVPKDKNDFDLLLFNDGEAMNQLGVKDIIDSLNKNKLIRPLIVVGIDAFEPTQEYGVSGIPELLSQSTLAEKYSNFVVNELLPFVKKKSGVRKFNSVSIAGPGLAGISALDIAWDNWQKFDKVGYLSDPSIRKTSIDFSLLVKKISLSRKRPRLQFWFPEIHDVKDSQRSDSTGMDKLFDVLEKKGLRQSISQETGADKKYFKSFKNEFSHFLLWLNEIH